MRSATASLLALAGLVIAPGSAQADPYRYHHDYYKLIAAKAATTQSQTGFRITVNPALTWLHRGLTPPHVTAAGPQSAAGVSHGFPWASVSAALAIAVVFATVLVATMRRTHGTAA